MTTNASGKLNMGGVSAIKDITGIPPRERSDRQTHYLAACLAALAHQPARWYEYQDWGEGGPVGFLRARGIVFVPVPDLPPMAQSYYGGCLCKRAHWSETGVAEE